MQLNLNSNIKSNFNTDGRTDGRYEEQLAANFKVTAVDAGARIGGMVTIGEISSPEHWLRSPERHPILRKGEREPIPAHVRQAVFYRDRGRCELCGWKSVGKNPWELDHITPWSAGGSDKSSNLRVLCEHHNQHRSNHLDVTERERRPVTWWCVNCFDGGNVWWYHEDGMPICPIHKGAASVGWRCRVTRSHRYHADQGNEMPTWHRRGPLENAHTIAYCAHCDAPGLTDVLL